MVEWVFLETDVGQLCGPRNHHRRNGGIAIEMKIFKLAKKMYFKQARVGGSYSAHDGLNIIAGLAVVAATLD